MSRIYCISGLGADKRVFRNLSVPGYELVPLDWVPYDDLDDIASYALKFAKEIKEDNPVIMGVSFGGMIAIEIAKQLPVRKVCLVSSAKVAAELGDPSFFGKWIINNKVVPSVFLTTPNPFIFSFFGAKTEDEKQLMRDIIRESDPGFVKWALKALLMWRNNVRPANVVQIHGTADKIILSSGVHPDVWVQGGSHMMVYNRAEEVSKISAENLPR
jgi:pimeloyl-ACP methyl ester carboxylesterase